MISYLLKINTLLSNKIARDISFSLKKIYIQDKDVAKELDYPIDEKVVQEEIMKPNVKCTTLFHYFK